MIWCCTISTDGKKEPVVTINKVGLRLLSRMWSGKDVRCRLESAVKTGLDDGISKRLTRKSY